ncbi:hypothetical protein P168DRAFT_330165 [Aspergillus campestris IBT 28561]|uniref:Uncharacterized protein n=1 Tax=Aspergillus campestris (strain IBT 28561) TaxID=1392248 RepID=A0A2I1CTC7_ASPC2|nr:uncharacterized protein P168DRAFT_330165 [Aspergillus campestris IBT 28561]PKY00865.1 hypothetical protein P168DRAFT_330165 [Aspergillus campestris IBT 28561]
MAELVHASMCYHELLALIFVFVFYRYDAQWATGLRRMGWMAETEADLPEWWTVAVAVKRVPGVWGWY